MIREQTNHKAAYLEALAEYHGFQYGRARMDNKLNYFKMLLPLLGSSAIGGPWGRLVTPMLY